MTRTRIAIVTAILAATTMLASTAEAGMKVRLGFGFPLGSFTAHGNSGGSYHKPRRAKRHYVRRKANDDVKVTKKSTKTKSVAKAEPQAKVESAEETATSENSSISTAAVAPAEAAPAAVETVPETPEAKPAEAGASTNKADCKKFFPSVGMTLTVPCE